MDNFFDIHRQKVETFNETFRKRTTPNQKNKVDIPENLFQKCPACDEFVYREDLESLLYICPKCHAYFPLGARKRIELFADKNSFRELDASLSSLNPLEFKGYPEKIEENQKKAGEIEAFVGGTARIGTIKVAIGALDSHFMMGSMGSVVGEKVTRLVEYATKNHLPLLIFSASGGARMQEGIFSLMQMAKTSAALSQHDREGLFYISVLTHPTTGGVAASFAFLGDVNIAEAGALIGFAGQRVIKQTIRQELPSGFQTADFQLEKGMVDMVVKREDLRQVLSRLLQFHHR